MTLCDVLEQIASRAWANLRKGSADEKLRRMVRVPKDEHLGSALRGRNSLRGQVAFLK